MATRALAATGEKILAAERTVTSALAITVRAFLPVIDDGAGATVAEGYSVNIEANAAGAIEVLDSKRRFVTLVQRGKSVQIVATGNLAASRYVVVDAPEVLFSAALATNASGVPTLASNLPAGAVTASTGWMRVMRPDGTFGLVVVWDEV